jgi:hypothetical protein
MSIMAVTLSICYIYIISKNCSARSIDWKFFKQSTLVFYGSCLVTAIESKQKWRLQDRNTKSVMGSAKGEEEFMDRSVYLKELKASQEWASAMGRYQEKAGFLGRFEGGAIPAQNSEVPPRFPPANNSVQRNDEEAASPGVSL